MVGRKVSHYEILATLGEGGMGVVYHARDMRLGRSVALKMLHPARSADTERRRLFIQEAKAASALNHPNIVTIYDIGADEGTDFIVMERVTGKPLSQSIPRAGMRVTDALAIAIPIADALAKAHAAGIVHRDLKPANLMVTADGMPKLLDFGLAKLVEGVAPVEEVGTATTLAHTEWIEQGAILGTLSYMSPEQAQGTDVDARSDVFSFGTVLYEMVTGQRAFQGQSPLAILAAILHTDPPPADEAVPGVPRPLGRLIARCLRKDPANRWQSIADVRNSLEEIRQDLDSGDTRASEENRRARLWTRNAAWSGLAAVAVVGLGAAAVWMRPRSVAESSAEIPQAVPFTSYLGGENSPSISRDGSQVAFVWSGDQQDNRDIYVKRFDAGPPLRLTRDPAEDDRPVWSPDGNSVAFLRRQSVTKIYSFPPAKIVFLSEYAARVIVVPSLGGLERIVVEG